MRFTKIALMYLQYRIYNICDDETLQNFITLRGIKERGQLTPPFRSTCMISLDRLQYGGSLITAEKLLRVTSTLYWIHA
jgi:hypothetical protein